LALKVALQYRMSDTVGVAAGCDVERTRHSTSAFGALAAEPAGIGLDEIAAKFAVGRRTFDILEMLDLDWSLLRHFNCRGLNNYRLASVGLSEWL
jgi:hypothetical protein